MHQNQGRVWKCRTVKSIIIILLNFLIVQNYTFVNQNLHEGKSSGIKISQYATGQWLSLTSATNCSLERIEIMSPTAANLAPLCWKPNMPLKPPKQAYIQPQLMIRYHRYCRYTTFQLPFLSYLNWTQCKYFTLVDKIRTYHYVVCALFQQSCDGCRTETYEISVHRRMRKNEDKRKLSRVGLFYSDPMVREDIARQLKFSC